MKIDKTSNPLPASAVNDANSRTAAARANPASANQVQSNVTSVHLGAASAQLRSMEGTPQIDEKKIAEIRQAISEGRFQVNSSAIADRLISSVQDLLSASKH